MKRSNKGFVGLLTILFILVFSYQTLSSDNCRKSCDGCSSLSSSSGQIDTVKQNEFATPDTLSEFSEFSTIDPNSSEFSEFSDNETLPDNNWGMVYQVIVLLLLGVVISLLLKYKWIVKFRSLVLLISLAYLGFYLGGCPCMIMSYQNTILLVLGEAVSWKSILWFVGLIPLTYFFGKVWCGWLCHLGALQEFLYRNPLGKTLSSAKSQRILKYIQLTLFVALIIQLIITRTNLFVKIDPFKVAFNLMSSNITGLILLVLLLVSSVFIYRPFCKGACPVGLVLGWVSRIPYSHKICIDKDNCNSCSRCIGICNQTALINDNKQVIVKSEECIACGECICKCNKDAIKL